MNTFTPFSAGVIALSLLTTVPLVVSAQNGRPPAPDLAPMAKALNVSEDVLQSCMPRPAKGERPAKPDAGKLASCLKADNAYVTEAGVDAALKKYAPKRAKRG